MRIPALVSTVALTAALAACGTADGAGGGTTPSPSGSVSTTLSPTPPPKTGTPTVPPPADDPLPTDLRKDPRVLAAIADAKGRAGIVPTDVVVASYSQVTWSDGSLGCPVEGKSYTQTMVDGELLLLRAGQRLLSYHAGNGHDFEYCANPSDDYTVRTG